MASKTSQDRRTAHVSHSPRCSVIITAYNVGPYIAEAVESALIQTERDIEVIIVNDGSTDDTRERLKELESRWSCDDRPLVVIDQPNKGEAAARNIGIHMAQAPYVGFLDGDDRWHPTMVERLVGILDTRSEIDAAHCEIRIIDEHGEDTGLQGRLTPGRKDFADVLLFRSLGQPSAMITRRSVVEAVGCFDESPGIAAEWDLWLRIATHRDWNILTVAEVLIDYRRRPQQLSKNWQKALNYWKVTVEKAKQRHPELVATLEREAYARRYLHCAALARSAGDNRAALKLTFQAWSRAWPKFAVEFEAWRKTLGILLCWLPSPVFGALQRSTQRPLWRR